MSTFQTILSKLVLFAICCYGSQAFGQHDLELINSIDMEFIRVPNGVFMMGSKKAARNSRDNEVFHEVTISNPFYLGKFEVTQAQYQKVMGNNPSYFFGDKMREQDPKTKKFTIEIDTSMHPVERVTVEKALEFCKLLGELPDEKRLGRKYRLPTEAEWEYACRARTDTAYSFGNYEGELGEYAWFADNSGEKQIDSSYLLRDESFGLKYLSLLKRNRNRTHPVGTKKPNKWGFYDMHGNVEELCSDIYGEYPSWPVTDPKGSTKGKWPVSRGGGWNDEARHCRSATRSPILVQAVQGDSVGFRVVLTFDPGVGAQKP
jgi:formylglycine-generating enzyme required for sulfatase activity